MKIFNLFSKSLKTKITAAVVGMVTLVLLITGMLIFRELHKAAIEDSKTIMTGIATGRQKALMDWFKVCWANLHIASEEIGAKVKSSVSQAHLIASLLFIQSGTKDFAELFVVDKNGSVIASTYEKQVGKDLSKTRYVKAGLNGDNFLEGPYIDSVTKDIGISSSRFLDEVTLIFSQPIRSSAGEIVALLCARVPNDVMSDILQDEASHIYKESGDNYLFMVESSTGIPPGTAISRSRFEDDSVVDGPNLKDGIQTEKWGIIKVERHTEFELHFIDPATEDLTEGIVNTIKKKQNLNTWPGYPDYRHIMVAGRSFIITPPYSPDIWGLMCEADIAEIYRHISTARGHAYLIAITLIIIFGLLNFFLIRRLIIKPLINVNDIVAELSKGGGDLTKRIEVRSMDEIGDICYHFNIFIKKLNDIISDIIRETDKMVHANNFLSEVAENTSKSSEFLEVEVTGASSAIEEISRNIQEVSKNIEVQSAAVNETSAAANEMASSVKQVANHAKDADKLSKEATHIATDGNETIKETLSAMQAISESSNKINEIIDVITNIADQTNLLALNAAIEAARAGEAGKGFAVVAEEVRNLAEQSAKAAKEITALIKDSAVKADKGVQLTNKVANVIQNALDSIIKISDLNEGIGTATVEQTTAAEEVAKAMDNVNQITHEITAAMEEQAAATQKLSNSIQTALSVAQQNKIGADTSIENVRLLTQHIGRLLEHMNKFKVDGAVTEIDIRRETKISEVKISETKSDMQLETKRTAGLISTKA